MEGELMSYDPETALLVYTNLKIRIIESHVYSSPAYKNQKPKCLLGSEWVSSNLLIPWNTVQL